MTDPTEQGGRPEQQPHPGGCGLQTCLVLAMVVSAVLVAIMIALAAIRLSEMR